MLKYSEKARANTKWASVLIVAVLFSGPGVAAEEQCSISDNSQKGLEVYAACVNTKLAELSALNETLAGRVKVLMEKAIADKGTLDEAVRKAAAVKFITRKTRCAAGEEYQSTLCPTGYRPDSNAGNHFCYPGQEADVICKVPG
ncbi:hypothetical protein [Mesorhizobium sp. M00.F.Ca.ET.217.01.1.1]|uniref:hypothetical protein n=1 Tax=Mesorhizobium sp. M00.F.Ca.ET.217.01.1.1 TaxID=2500529 RepID=UPI000FD99D5F|nr:hypothetical protein [Mesorhizobium sp. M00.F.Ca.ET.217.01.1.1]TGQ20045.1 hypothetical protein EN860_014955 [Mesorhizobium sp. M00.F.Ca.ET.217.01.1.1]TGV94502.1 hypothetical protein EN801_002405 [Mesorhizobium sp. M00.F.Ca.ET.158.01.1.1]